MKKIYLILIIILPLLLIANEFVIFPISPHKSVAASCGRVNLSELIKRSEIILTGTADDSKWVTIDASKGRIETHTEINIDRIIKGDYDDDKITVRQFGGCDYRLNFCISVSVATELEKGVKYLLFLSDPDENGVYGGFSDCAGSYPITLDDYGNEILSCRLVFYDPEFHDAGLCTEEVVPCPPRNYTSEIEGEVRECRRYYVFLRDLIEQIKIL